MTRTFRIAKEVRSLAEVSAIRSIDLLDVCADASIVDLTTGDERS